MQAKNLRIGESFNFVNLQNNKNGICLRISETAVYVSFDEQKYPNEPWKRICDYIACETEVIPIKKDLIKIERNSSGELIAHGNSLEKKKRGRKGIKIVFPKEKFSIPVLAAKLGCSNTHIYLQVKELVKKGEIQEFEEKRKKGQRGKSKKSYKVLDYIHSNKK
jgi:hypothetical protein